MGLIRLLAGALLVLWLLRLLRRTLFGIGAGRQRGPKPGPQPERPRKKRGFSADGIEEADYEELP